MWELEFSDEAKFYFIDNGDLVFDLLVRIEQLRRTPDAVPSEGCTQIEPNVFMWYVLRHMVVYRKKDGRLIIAVIKPIE